MRNAFSNSESAASPDEIALALAALSSAELCWLAHDWQVWARDDQLPPEADARGQSWRTWLILGGRGSGKTRAGAEWVRAEVARLGGANRRSVRIALIGETIDQVRSVMVEGVSGLLGVHPISERPVFEPSKKQVAWPGGAIAQLFSADDPESLRGPQFDLAWVDEIAKWRQAERAWDMLQFGLRLGAMPRQVVTTTPRPVPILKRIMGEEGTVTTRVRTADNAANLAPAFMAEMTRRYSGTLLGRQELEGELIEDVSGALWRRDWIEQHRLAAPPPPLQRIVVAVDPPVTATKSSDACGICVAGLGSDGRAYVIADRTLQGREPQVWARAAVSAYRDFGADRIVAEVNQGGDLVQSVLRQIDPGVPIRMVRATRGKWLRAEPVAALYAEGRVSHVGDHSMLEAQMLAFGTDGRASGKSPDRLDALVWALTDLVLDAPDPPLIRTL